MNEYRNPENIEAEIEQTREQMSETLDAIQHKLSPGRVIDDVLGYFRSDSSSGSHMGENLMESIKQNPLPVTLVGIGLGWLMMSGNNPPPRRQSSHYPSGSADNRPGSPHYTSPGVATTASNNSTPGSTASGSSDSLKDKAGDVADSVREKVSATTHSIGEQTNRMIDGVSDQVGRQVEHTRQGFNNMLNDQPLTLIGMGFAVGAALGAAFPATRREDELLGEARDELKDRALAAGGEQLEKAKAIADEALGAAQDEAEKRGLTGDSGKEKISEVADSARQVASAAKSAAKKEAEKQGIKSPATARDDEKQTGSSVSPSKADAKQTSAKSQNSTARR